MAVTHEKAPPCTMVIFGGIGDLSRRLLMPSLLHLWRDGLLSDKFRVIGVSRGPLSDEEYRKELGEALQEFAPDVPHAEELLGRASYIQGQFDDPATYRRIKEALARTSAGRGGNREGEGGNVLFYLATAPSFFAPIASYLARSGLAHEEAGHWRRIIIEKPFGRDLASAKALNAALLEHLDETQIYRIDHYLGKETVQNIMVFRFANGIFESLWNRDRIDHVQITVAETVGVGTRGSFYEDTGALRDMVPNHIFQLLALVAMEAPMSFDADAVRSERAKLLGSIRPLNEETVARDVVRAQYGAGTVDGKPVPAYRQEGDVDPESVTETYVAMKLAIDNWRWAGVPFYLRTGKRLAKRTSEIAIQFKPAPIAFFRDTPIDELASNQLILRVQPDEGLSLQFGAKTPGPKLAISGVKMNFAYKDYFNSTPATGYETLLYDAMIGDATLFQRADNIEAGWRVVDPILRAWEKTLVPPALYAPGSAGPAEAEDLLRQGGREWRKI